MDKFISKEFSPAQVLANSNLEVTGGKEYENLYMLRADAHERSLKAMPSEIEGISGPGGFPLPKLPQQRFPEGRQFHEDQGPLPGHQGKRLRNVLLRMEEIQGPLATLRQCRDSITRIKVYTRNHSNVRSILTGYVVAFDKYWNLVLRDVDEVFQKKIRCATASLGSVENYVKVADLSIQSDEESSGKWKETSCAWPNPFAKLAPVERKGAKLTAGEGYMPSVSKVPEELQCSSFLSKSSSFQYEKHAAEPGSSKRTLEEKRRHPSTTFDRKVDRKEKRSMEGVRIDRRTMEVNSSRLKDVVTLQLGRQGKKPEDVSEDDRWRGESERSEWERKEIERGGKNRRYARRIIAEEEKMRKELQRLEEVEEEEEDTGDNKTEEADSSSKRKTKRKRRRRKYEIRERHVKQLLIRGENIVLINVLQV